MKTISLVIFLCICAIALVQKDYGIEWFAVLTLFVSLSFKNPENEVVNLAYYFLGIVGVVLFYYSQKSDLLRAEETLRIQNAESQIVMLESDLNDFTPALVETNRDLIIAQIRMRIDEAIGRVDSRVYACDISDVEEDYCDKLFKEQREIEKLRSSGDLNNVLNQYNNPIVLKWLRRTTPIRISDIDVKTDNAIALLFSSEGYEDIRAEIQNEINKKRDDVRYLKSKRRSKESKISVINIIVLALWPYVVCIAFGLKLSQVDIRKILSSEQ